MGEESPLSLTFHRNKKMKFKQLLKPISVKIEKSKKGKVKEISFSISILWIIFILVAIYLIIKK